MIYFIRCKCSDGDFVKIGISNNPECRVRKLQTGNPHRLTLLAVMDGDRFKESELHQQFDDFIHSICGTSINWFKLSPEICAFIIQHCTVYNSSRELKAMADVALEPLLAVTGVDDSESRHHVVRAKQRYRHEIEEAIGNAKDTGAREIVNAANGEEIYAYPIPGSRVAWGVNDETGWNILRGIRRPDGADEAEG